MDRARQRRLYEQGVADFNAGNYFDAHEHWEALWMAAEGQERSFYQGLIQMAVALYHFQRGNPAGVRKLYIRAREHWADLPYSYRGLDLRAFEQAMGDALTDILDAAAPIDTPFAPRPLPRIVLVEDAFG